MASQQAKAFDDKEPVLLDMKENHEASVAAAAKRRSAADCCMGNGSVDWQSLHDLDSSSCASLVNNLKFRGHARITLPSSLHHALTTYHKDIVEPYFSLASDVKERHRLNSSIGADVYGYFARHDMGKELFQIRRSDAKAEWPNQPDSSFRDRSMSIFNSMHSIAISLVRAIGYYLTSSSSSSSPDASLLQKWYEMCDGGEPGDNPLCSTLLDLFHYHSKPKFVSQPCYYHFNEQMTLN
jgi:hypothetical protein